jgi:hypothetical protein
MDSEDLEEDVRKLHTDMYLGNGRDNPSITTRLSMVEDKIERMSKNLNKALWLVAGTLLGVIGEIVAKIWR